MNNKIWLSLAHMGGNEQKYIKEAFDTNWVVPLGPNVNEFEKDLERYLISPLPPLTRGSSEASPSLRGLGGGNKAVVALSSGTAALHLALIQLGVGYGDEVICQSFTFAASANPICYLGAKPVFVDSEVDTWNMSPFWLEEAIKDRIAKTGKAPKAIIPVHLYGMPAKMDEINEIAAKYEIPVIEDAAEALGSKYKGQNCGTLGEFGVLSFNGNKIITTSGGGALVCSTEQQSKKTMFLATQARDNAPHYQHSEIGYNYRMSNICAGIGRGQMEVLDQRVVRRRETNQLYRELLTTSPLPPSRGEAAGNSPSTRGLGGGFIKFQTQPNSDYFSNYWLTTILIDPAMNGVTREDLRLACESANIETRPLWKPMHLQPVFANASFYGDGTSEQLFDQGLCLPSGTSLSNEDIHRVSETIIKLFKVPK